MPGNIFCSKMGVLGTSFLRRPPGAHPLHKTPTALSPVPDKGAKPNTEIKQPGGPYTGADPENNLTGFQFTYINYIFNKTLYYLCG